MTTIDLPTASQPYVLDSGDGVHQHFFNHLATMKVAAGETGAMDVVEFTAPRGFGPPLHVHDRDDEVMIVLAGEVVFRSSDEHGEPIERTARDGSTVFLPAGVPHTFQVLSDSATFTTISASRGGASHFGGFVAELGEPLERPEVPAPVDIDPERVANAGARHGITVLGPPPAPLD